MEVTTLKDICYPPLSSLIQYPTPRYDATLKKYSRWQEGFNHLGFIFLRWLFTLKIFGTIINNLYFFFPCHSRYYFSWPSSDRIGPLGHWAIGPVHTVSIVLHKQLTPIIAPQNLAFRLLRRKGGFWYLHLIPSVVLLRLAEPQNAFLPTQGTSLILRHPERAII